MSGYYVTELVDVLRAAGCRVGESGITNGWQHRARSSGGFPVVPLGIQWHHTASQADPQNDLSFMIDGSDDAPVGNVLLDRTGKYWPVAAGAANTAGKGGPLTLSRGTIPVDQANTRTFAFEVANSGTGEPWPAVQLDAYFAGSNALNAHFGNQPGDVFTHALGAGDGWTDRKIDPATATAVQGPWRPIAVTNSGTWSLVDIRRECIRRAQPVPPPQGDELVFTILSLTDNPAALGGMADNKGIIAQVTWLGPTRYDDCIRLGAPVVTTDSTQLYNMDLLGPLPTGLNAGMFANHIT